MSKQVVTLIKAGLGNQLFQYAAGYALAKDLGIPLGMDVSWFSKKTLPARIEFRDYGLPVVFRHSDPKGLPAVRERAGFIYQELPKEPCFLVGHWQTEKYFAHHRERILELFGPPCGFASREFDISIHVRGTDFLRLGSRKGLGMDHYFRETLQKAKEELGHKCSVGVFTDDPPYARKVLGKVEIQERRKRDLEDIWAMSKCRNQIIANSSFSWWAAWLNPRKKKKVYYPSMVLKPHPPVEETDYIPEEWK